MCKFGDYDLVELGFRTTVGNWGRHNSNASVSLVAFSVLVLKFMQGTP